MSSVGAWSGTLADARADRRGNALALVAGVVVAVLLAQFAWLGFVAGGAVAGLGQRTVLRGAGAGLLVGALSWVAFAGLLASYGALDTALGMGRVLSVSVAIPVVAGTLGGLLRGVV